MKLTLKILYLLLLCTPPLTSSASKTEDPHYTDAGFFDIHYCNWPDQKPFYMALFSTSQYKNLKTVQLYTPKGNSLGNLNLKQYRLIKRKNKPDKRVFITHFETPELARDGWFKARITLQENSEFTARDYVLHKIMPQAQGLHPADDEDIPIPEKLIWEPVAGANFYQVYIRDVWNSDKLIFSSKLVTVTSQVIPENLLKPGGLYSWKVHARDVNEDIKLGDFNHGSNSKWVQFSVSED